jgi:hypothetical protein
VSDPEFFEPVRPGVHVPRGATFIIPAGALQIIVDDEGGRSMEVKHVEAAVQTWPDWLEIAFARFADVRDARRRLLEARGSGTAEGAALADEFQAALQTISAAVFALDAFYGVISGMVPLSDAVKEARRRSRAGRAVWVADAIGRAARMPNEVRKLMTKSVHTAYVLRNGAVHPRHSAEPYAVHLGLNQAVPHFYARYALETSHGAVGWATEAIMWVVDRPQPRNRAVNDFAGNASDLLHGVVDKHLTARPGATVGPRPPRTEGGPPTGP